MDDRSIRLQALSGCCLFEITLSTDEVASVQTPPTIFFLIPRASYLTCIYSELYTVFKEFVAGPSSESAAETRSLWFETFDDECPISWNLPVGLLCDGHFPLMHTGPHKLVLKFQNFPSTLLPFRSPSQFASSFCNQLKASLMVCHKSYLASFNRLSKQQVMMIQDVTSKSENVREVIDLIDTQIRKAEKVVTVPLQIHILQEKHINTLTLAVIGDMTISDLIKQYLPDVVYPCAISSGIDLPKDAVLSWCYSTLSSLDGWLHILVKNNASV